MRKSKQKALSNLFWLSFLLAVGSYAVYGIFHFGILSFSPPYILCRDGKWGMYDCLAFFYYAPIPLLILTLLYSIIFWQLFFKQARVAKKQTRRLRKK